MVIELKGDLLETDVKVICHGVNCQNEMKSGVAKALFTKWPEVKEGYHKFMNGFTEFFDSENFLGLVNSVELENDRIILNCFTQYDYGNDGHRYVDYEAIYKCFKNIGGCFDEVAIPKIGCGLGGGNWEIVKRIIEDAVGDKCKVFVYYKED
jgi:O-acetyl-ADP-ribose deacetylase (regulator of RNase III)